MKILIFIYFLTFPLQYLANDDRCSSVESKQFDFWIGEWKVEWTDSTGNKIEGRNTITKTLSGCVLEENFNGEPGIPFKGKSFSVYNPQKNKWQQTWVDNSGAYMLFEGEFDDNKMILSTERINRENKRVLLRMVFYNISGKSFDWDWQRSVDGEPAWETTWKIHYTRLN